MPTWLKALARFILLTFTGFVLWDVGAKLGSGYIGLGVFLALLVGLRITERKLAKDAVLRREFERQLAKESYLHPDHRPDPDKWTGGAG